ncbi:hypothetical protein PIB30_033309 [Stylosanthes scabra]|uniref:Uncharacterized protein n=1 Tax=Stylosanthes scabra TaxID=79078 RepID=A0ABU6TC60_9FABA|nr:hypothetical protein [Stylosanthes scabra]
MLLQNSVSFVNHNQRDSDTLLMEGENLQAMDWGVPMSTKFRFLHLSFLTLSRSSFQKDEYTLDRSNIISAASITKPVGYLLSPCPHGYLSCQLLRSAERALAGCILRMSKVSTKARL